MGRPEISEAAANHPIPDQVRAEREVPMRSVNAAAREHGQPDVVLTVTEHALV